MALQRLQNLDQSYLHLGHNPLNAYKTLKTPILFKNHARPQPQIWQLGPFYDIQNYNHSSMPDVLDKLQNQNHW